PAHVGVPVTFTAPATGSCALAWHWDFGDGGNPIALDDQISHTFIAPGTYDITLTVIDCHDLTAIFTLSLEVIAGNDSDGDGYFDSEEIALGTNPHDPNSKPGGTADFDDDGKTDDKDTDDDNDLMTDAEEYAQGTDPYDPNSVNRSPLVVTKLSGTVKV